MLDQIMTTLIAFLGVVIILGLFFVFFVLWSAREYVEQAKKAKNDSYSKDELIRNIHFSKNRGNVKAATHWQEILDRKYPEEPYRG